MDRFPSDHFQRLVAGSHLLPLAHRCSADISLPHTLQRVILSRSETSSFLLELEPSSSRLLVVLLASLRSITLYLDFHVRIEQTETRCCGKNLLDFAESVFMFCVPHERYVCFQLASHWSCYSRQTGHIWYVL